MPLPYRTVLHLPPSTDLVRIAEQELQSWLEAKKKVDVRHRDGLSNGRFFEPGVHSLGKGRSLAVAHLEQSDRAGRQLLMRFTEKSKSGIWQIDMLVLDSGEASQQPDTLLIEGKKVDAPDAEGQVDPPTLVSRLLARGDGARFPDTGHLRTSDDRFVGSRRRVRCHHGRTPFGHGDRGEFAGKAVRRTDT